MIRKPGTIRVPRRFLILIAVCLGHLTLGHSTLGHLTLGHSTLGLLAQEPESRLSDSDSQRSLRTACDESFQQGLAELAEWARGRELEAECRETMAIQIPRDPQRQYIFLPADSAGPEQEVRNAEWRERLQRLRKRYAQDLFIAAKEAAQAGQAADAYQWLHEVLHWDPEHLEARNALGHRKSDGEWLPYSERLAVREASRPHAELNWPARSYHLITTENFEIASQAEEAMTRQLAEQLQRWHWVWRQVFFEYWSSSAAVKSWIDGKSKSHASTRKYRVVFFRDREQYVNELEKFVPGVGASTGYYNDAMKISFFYASSERDITDTWRHELTHQLFQESTRTRIGPFTDRHLWLGEGIAMYLESLRDFGRFVTLGGFDARRLQYARVRRLRENWQIPFQQLAGMNLREFQSHPEVSRLYSQAAGMTQFLMTADQGRYRDRLIKFLELVYAGNVRPEVWEKTLQLTAEEFDAAYLKFLQVRSTDLAEGLIAPAAVTELALPGSGLESADFIRIGGCTQLVWLDVSGNPLSPEKIGALSGCSQLRQVFAVGCPIPAGTLSAFAQLRSLQELDLSSCELTNDDLSGLSRLVELRVLTLQGARLPEGIAAAIDRLPNLAIVEISGAAIAPEELKQLKAINRPWEIRE